ncbi:MAG: coproporphyrinogen oxidase [Acidobacteria bacterium]|nr:coproporphyrinogen oxidase [Acidobacteriota bacterium]
MPLGVYLHLPFCRVRCSYCPFAVSTDIALQDRYTDALVRELGSRANGERVDTVFVGGGTPSRMSDENLIRTFEALRANYAVDADAEISIEANPEDLTPQSLAFWRSLGINRISIGVQSLHDRELLPLGRVHGAERAREAVRDAVASGVRTSLDIILGLPQQTAESFAETLDAAIAAGVGHISLYMLDLEEGTSLERQVAIGRTSLPDDELIAASYVKAIARLGAAGLQQYEISNFAREGEECRHNLRYWRREEYQGFGIGAHSFIGSRRFANTRDIDRYIDGLLEPDFTEELGPEEKRHEDLFLQLRQTSGIHYDDIERLCGQEGIRWIERGLMGGWLKRVGARVAFTPSGFLLSSDYISQLF